MNSLIYPLVKKVKPLYDSPNRFYHTWKHIEKCLVEYEEIKREITLPIALELAIIYHDAVYDQSKPEQNDEMLSSELAREQISQEPKLPLKDILAITAQDLILCTKHHIPMLGFGKGLEMRSKYLIDIDLSIFGAPEEEFWEYETNIRKEYQIYLDDVYNTERSKIIEGFLECDYIYFSEYFRDKYENTARKNLKALLEKLN